jgi:uncharacterized protein (DUF1697 family)
MPRFVAFLRGVSPLNAKMPDLKRCFEVSGFTNVRTILSSGNVVFDAPDSTASALERQAEQAMQLGLGKSFYTIVRSASYLQDLLISDPYIKYGIPVEAKRVVTFMREPQSSRIALPLAQDQASVFCLHGREAFTAYVATDKGPVFMKLIEQAFGKAVTTRTWETVAKCSKA